MDSNHLSLISRGENISLGKMEKGCLIASSLLQNTRKSYLILFLGWLANMSSWVLILKFFKKRGN